MVDATDISMKVITGWAGPRSEERGFAIIDSFEADRKSARAQEERGRKKEKERGKREEEGERERKKEKERGKRGCRAA